MDLNLGKLLFVSGLGMAGLGLLVLLGGRLGLGRLPGDIVVRGENATFYFPVVTSIVLSIVMTLILWLVQSLRR